MYSIIGGGVVFALLSGISREEGGMSRRVPLEARGDFDLTWLDPELTRIDTLSGAQAAVLEQFGRASTVLHPSQIARELGKPLAATLAIINRLVASGYLEITEHDSLGDHGLVLTALGRRALSQAQPA